MQRWQQMGLLGPLGLVRRVVSLTRRHSEDVAGGRTLSKNGQSRLCSRPSTRWFSMQKKIRHQHEVAALSRKLTHARLPKKTIFPGAAWWRRAGGVLAVCLLAVACGRRRWGMSIAGSAETCAETCGEDGDQRRDWTALC